MQRTSRAQHPASGCTLRKATPHPPQPNPRCLTGLLALEMGQRPVTACCCSRSRRKREGETGGDLQWFQRLLVRVHALQSGDGAIATHMTQEQTARREQAVRLSDATAWTRLLILVHGTTGLAFVWAMLLRNVHDLSKTQVMVHAATKPPTLATPSKHKPLAFDQM